MAVSKRTRFEVLRRDNYTCRYCRSTDNPLRVDHVTPVALGGTDDPANLVAACQDCNAGKASSSLDEATVAQVSDDAIRWREAMRQAMDEVNAERDQRLERFTWFTDSWEGWDETRIYLPGHWIDVLTEWDAIGVRKSDVYDALEIALRNRGVAAEAVFNYMRGIIRNRTAEAVERARKIMEENGGA
jgi:hypothetical protein